MSLPELGWNMQHLKCSHTIAYDISVCQRMIIRSYTQICVLGTLGIHLVRSSYAGIRRCTSLYAEAKIFFWTWSKIFSVCERIDNTLLKRSSYARHTLDTLGICWIRYTYARGTLLIRWYKQRPVELKIYKGSFFSPFSSVVDIGFSLTPFWFNKFDTLLCKTKWKTKEKRKEENRLKTCCMHLDTS